MWEIYKKKCIRLLLKSSLSVDYVPVYICICIRAVELWLYNTKMEHSGTVGWGSRIHRRHLCRGVRPPHQRVSWIYDTKQSDCDILVMLELWGIQSTILLPSLPGPLWPRVEALDRVLSMGQIELNCVLMLNWITWNRSVYMYKMDLALNNLQWFICHKTQPTINMEYWLWVISNKYYCGIK